MRSGRNLGAPREGLRWTRGRPLPAPVPRERRPALVLGSVEHFLCGHKADPDRGPDPRRAKDSRGSGGTGIPRARVSQGSHTPPRDRGGSGGAEGRLPCHARVGVTRLSETRPFAVRRVTGCLVGGPQSRRIAASSGTDPPRHPSCSNGRTTAAAAGRGTQGGACQNLKRATWGIVGLVFRFAERPSAASRGGWVFACP